jgi:sulfide:quinone oxidoreductase
VGGGVTNKEVTEKNEADLIPRGVTWIRDAVVAFEPAENRVRLAVIDLWAMTTWLFVRAFR